MSTFITKAYIAASCDGVVRRFVRNRWRVIDPRVSLVWFFSLKISVCLVTVTRYFPSRVFMTFSLALHAGATHPRFDLCRSVFLLDADIRLLFLLFVAVQSFCWMRPSLMTWLCTLLSAACLGGAFLLSYHSRASKARLAPFPRLPILRAFRALSSLKLAGSRSATLNLATALLSARGRA